MRADSWMYLFLALTSVGIVVTIVTGKKAMRRPHLTSVVVTAILLLITLYFAKETGKILNFPPDRHAVHMPLARTAFYALLIPVITGILHWFGKVGKRVHTIAVGIFLVALAAALGTGAAMMMGATPKPI